jgi:hypothetical protein
VDNTAIVVAVVTAVGGVMAALITSMRRENRDDHALVTDQISAVYRLLNRIGDKVDTHLDWHHEGNIDGKSKGRDRRE